MGLRELSLFTGAGGGVLGSKLLGWRTVGYVEINDYCQRVIAQRIKDGILDEAPIFGDIRAFISEGYARSYQGMVDVVAAGFPCQPFSNAGLRGGEFDPRNMWPQTIETIRLVKPRIGVLLENVSGLLTYEYFGTILRDLAQGGYVGRWDCLPASAFGADHHRDRVWIFAYAKHAGRWMPREGRDIRKTCQKPSLARRNLPERFASRDSLSGRLDTPKPLLFRNVDDVADWMDRLKAAGNGQVPIVVKEAWEILSQSTTTR